MKLKTALYAEFIGTFAMVLCGTAAMAVNETTGAVAHEGVAITWGLIVMVMIYAFSEHSVFFELGALGSIGKGLLDEGQSVPIRNI